MLLITGGAFQGKLEYTLNRTGILIEDIIDGATCEWNELLEKPLINHFHLWIGRMLIEGNDVNALLDIIMKQNPDMVIIVDELGCGIVPVDAYNRNYREITGRICCIIAREATEVHRVICGIGTVIKPL